MRSDITQFNLLNVVDTCSVWNILASARIYSACNEGKCSFCLTAFVVYECLIKPRKNISEIDILLQRSLRNEQSKGKFQKFNLSINDLQEVKLLENRKKLGLGELSSIAYAKKTNAAFLTDDKLARNLADEILGKNQVQTTPHLVGYLFYTNLLSDSDLDLIINQHNASIIHRWGKLEEFFRIAYKHSWELRLLKRQ